MGTRVPAKTGTPPRIPGERWIWSFLRAFSFFTWGLYEELDPKSACDEE